MGRIYNIEGTTEKWEELVPKVYKVSEAENNSMISYCLKDAEEHCDGK